MVSDSESESRIDWIDGDTYETVRLVAKAYGLSVQKIVPSGKKRCEAVLTGKDDRIARLSCDRRCLGLPEPFVTMCPATRKEYLKWLKVELRSVGVDFSPDSAV